MYSSREPITTDALVRMQGQLDSLQALWLGLANLCATKEEIREVSLARLEMLRTATHAEPIDEPYFQAIDNAERWIRTVTD
jgi:hypothetical protein